MKNAVAFDAAVTILTRIGTVILVVAGIFHPARAVEAGMNISQACSEREHNNNTDEPNTRIEASTHANFSHYFSCVDSIARESSETLFLPSGRESSRQPPYTSLSCAPEPSACFRAVYDGYEDILDLPGKEQAERLRSVVESLIVPKRSGSGDDERRQPTPLVRFLLRSLTFDEENTKEYDGYGGMHVDYFEASDYVYTAILYGEPSEDLVGGETAFVNTNGGFADKTRRRVQLESELTVEPKKGRLLLFTGGGENVHAPLRVARGQRPTLHVWFKCGEG